MRRIQWTMALAAFALAGCGEGATEPEAQAVAVESAAEARGERPAAQGQTIVDVAIAVNADTGLFDTLIGAVLAADLAEALSEVGQKTVFAPTDAAFAEIGLTEANIGDVPTEMLRNILLYHVANGKREAADVASSDQIRMLNGGFNAVETDGGKVFIGDEQAEVLIPDVAASNGVIHVIDAVLLPGGEDDSPGGSGARQGPQS